MSDGEMLVVDDNPGDVRIIEEAFDRSELTPTVHTVNTRAEALDFVLRRNEHEDAPRLDVVLLDWRLSQTTGEQVLRAAESATPPISVVVMTGSKPPEKSMGEAASKAERIIEKPSDPEKYVELLRPYLSAR